MLKNYLRIAVRNLTKYKFISFIYLFSLTVGITCCLLIMYNWLQTFAYHIPIQWWVFALAGILAACIALATISIQAVRAAPSNPVNSLRNE